MYDRDGRYQMTDSYATRRYSDRHRGTRRSSGYDRRMRSNGNVAYDPDYDEDIDVIKKIRNKRSENLRLEERAEAARLKRLEASRGMNMPTCIAFTAILFAMMFLLIDYVSMKTDVIKVSKQIATKQEEYNSLKSKNDSKLKEIETSINLNEIAKIAVDELGMVKAEESQIIMFNKNESAYVRQYDDLPETAADNVFDDVLKAID